MASGRTIDIRGGLIRQRPPLAGATLAIAALLFAVAVACSPFGRSYETNGERLYFSATNEDGTRIGYEGGPRFGAMGGSGLTCASCHGADAGGGTRFLHMTRVEAPDIRWSSLAGEGGEHDEDGHGAYDLETFRAP